MEIAVVDDLEMDLKRIQEAVGQYLQSHGLEAEIYLFPTVAAFRSVYRPNRFSLLLLDIYLPDGTGLELARHIRSQGDRGQIVFVSSSDEFAVDGYEVDACNYLLKPVDDASVFRTLDRCFAHFKSAPRYLEIISNRVPVRVPLDSIIWINKYRNILSFHTDGGELKSYMTFQTLMEKLEGDPRFLACYRGCLINMDRVADIKKDFFLMDNGDHAHFRKQDASQLRLSYIQYRCENAPLL